MDSVYLQGKRIRLDPAKSIGKGGEADVYDLGDGRALKVFKSPDHPDYEGQPEAQAAAAHRLAVHQSKLLDFPKGLPAAIVAPQIIATDRSGTVALGYAMRKVAAAEPLLRLSEPTWRLSGGSVATLVTVFRAMHGLVEELHRHQVTIGDFNDLNVLVAGTQPYFIDADSFQFGAYLCPVFTERVVDPLLCDVASTGLTMKAPHSPSSDWYAFAALLMQSLLFVGPYGGIYRPKRSTDRAPASQRPIRRITVFHPEVQYPRPAAPLRTLPDDLLQRFHQIFVEDRRGAFPIALLNGLNFQKCASCGLEHARTSCPACAPRAGALGQQHISVRGNVTARCVFETRGRIVHITVESGELRWLVLENGQLSREDGSVVPCLPPDPRVRFGIQGRTTLIARAGELRLAKPGAPLERLSVDARHGDEPTFAAAETQLVWAHAGQLFTMDTLGPKRIGDVLEGNTRLWLGASFGLGFSQAGRMTVAFIFDPRRKMLNDGVSLPPLPGQLLDAECVFGPDRAWLFVATRQGGRTIHSCFVIAADGRVEARAEAVEGDGTWLGTLKGKCAVGPLLFATTDMGLVRVECAQGGITQTRSFPDTEPFVDSASTLLLTKEGLCAATNRRITALKMS